MTASEEDLRKELAYLKEQAKRLDKLIEVLLNFAKLGRELYSVPIMDQHGQVYGSHNKRPEYNFLEERIKEFKQ